MSECERTGTRPLEYSRWHRTESTKRFVGPRGAFDLGTIDIDWCEYCRFCSEPLALIETQEARYTKHATVTLRLARMAGIPAYSVAYAVNANRDDITDFWVRELYPNPDERDWVVSPSDYAKFLLELRSAHREKYSERGGCWVP